MELETPWSKARKLRSSIHEESIADLPGGRLQPNSGRFWRWKRDGIVWNFLIEARHTDAASYKIDKKEFQTIRGQALRTPPGLKPAMLIEIQELRLVAMEEVDFEMMLVRIVELEAKFGDG